MIKRSIISLVVIWVQFTAQAQMPEGIVLDGSISFAELTDTMHFKMVQTGTYDVTVKKNMNYHYLGIRSTGIVTLVLHTGDSLVVIHASGGTARGKYSVGKDDSARMARNFIPVTESPAYWDFIGPNVSRQFLSKEITQAEIIRQHALNLKQKGYAGTTVDMGSRYDFEFVIDRAVFPGAKLLVMFRNDRNAAGYFPDKAVLTGSALQDQNINAAALDKTGAFKVDTSIWWQLD